MGNKEMFATRLREARTQMKKTQKEFADMVESTAATISAYENATKNPSLEIVINIAEKCNVSIDWLCGLSEKKNNSDKIETYADMFQLIIKLTSFGDWDIIFEDNSIFDDINRTGINYACLRNYDDTIVNLFKDWEQMKNLYDKGTIDKHLYDLWLLDKLKQFDNMPLYPPFENDIIPQS